MHRATEYVTSLTGKSVSGSKRHRDRAVIVILIMILVATILWEVKAAPETNPFVAVLTSIVVFSAFAYLQFTLHESLVQKVDTFKEQILKEFKAAADESFRSEREAELNHVKAMFISVTGHRDEGPQDKLRMKAENDMPSSAGVYFTIVAAILLSLYCLGKWYS